MGTRLSSRSGPAIRTESGAGRRKLIDLTPLIDVVFILLVFFMLSATAASWDTILLGPPVRASTEQSGPPALLVQLGKDGSVMLDRQPTTGESLPEALRAALQTAPDRPVVVQPERGVPLQRVVTLLDSLAGIPAGTVSLMRAGEEAL